MVLVKMRRLVRFVELTRSMVKTLRVTVYLLHLLKSTGAHFVTLGAREVADVETRGAADHVQVAIQLAFTTTTL